MTKEEINSLITENIKLAYIVLNKYAPKVKNLIDYEELKSICLLGLTKAANTFNPDKGFAFSTYACKVISNDVLMELRSVNKLRKTISIETSTTDNLTILDMLYSDENIENDFLLSNTVDKLRFFIKNLPKREQKIINYTIDGLTQVQIAKALGISQTQVSRLYNKALNTLRFDFENYD